MKTENLCRFSSVSLKPIPTRRLTTMYIPVCHTNRRPIKNTIGMVMNRLVGMVLKCEMRHYYHNISKEVFQIL